MENWLVDLDSASDIYSEKRVDWPGKIKMILFLRLPELFFPSITWTFSTFVSPASTFCINVDFNNFGAVCNHSMFYWMPNPRPIFSHISKERFLAAIALKDLKNQEVRWGQIALQKTNCWLLLLLLPKHWKCESPKKALCRSTIEHLLFEFGTPSSADVS